MLPQQQNYNNLELYPLEIHHTTVREMKPEQVFIGDRAKEGAREIQRWKEKIEKKGEKGCGDSDVIETERDRDKDTDTDTDRDNSIRETQIFVETKSGVTTFQTAGPFNFFCPV